ncbi:Wzz/FepE/Etk N-terminal domain-containing protein [Flavisolibacter tropicus]|uniref:Polysaccharide chain length determinant N-terminal domain-containing protein n=1 Tax=Flavisolibacter tropicus TaxID=1492898 RepID=A0A172TSQ2_9BACT|nr:Wzz/FepE/Etk N-terminal domain-containing protein [Flavisolibacter tropicus]ANE50022.1 hypothetical protein SY85_05440 [Flavisolibacter tropicus]
MEVNKEYSLVDILKILKSFSQYLFKRWWLLAIVMLAGAGLGVVFYYKQKPKYEAVTTFILEEKSSGGGGLAGLASQFGVNLGGLGGGGSMFSGDNILNILKSKNVIQRVLLTKIEDTTYGGQTLSDLYLDFSGIKKAWQEEPLLAKFSFVGAEKQMSPLQDSVLNIIYEAITKNNIATDRTSKQGSIIKVQVTAENSLFARLMTERLVEEASKLYFDIKTGTAEANIQQLQRRSDSLLMLLNRKSFTAAASLPLDINPGIRTGVVPSEIATRDKTVLATLYTEVTKNLEASKLVLSQQMPVIQILDRPGYLLVDKKKGRLFWVATFLVGLSAIYISGIFLYFLRVQENRYNR